MTRAAGLGRSLEHLVAVPPGPDGRPGERILATSRTTIPPSPPGPGGSRTDFRVFLGAGGTSLGAACLGRVEDRGDPETCARRALETKQRAGIRQDMRLRATQIGGEPALTYRLAISKRAALTEWMVARRGWVFVTGIAHMRHDDRGATIRRARDVLGTWQWLDQPREHRVPDVAASGLPPVIPPADGAPGQLPHVIEVPPGEDGRPGVRILALNASSMPVDAVRAGATRCDFVVPLLPDGAVLVSTSMGRVSEQGEPLVAARRDIAANVQRGLRPSLVRTRRVAGHDGTHHRLEHFTCVEDVWHTARAGWLFCLRMRTHDPRREHDSVAAAERVLADWMWVDA